MLNKVTLIGRVGQDPEVRHLENGAVVARFSLATNEKIKLADGTRQDRTEWHDVVVWRKLAEIAEKYVTKGKLLYIEGKLRTRKYDDKNGVSRKTTEIVADNFQMLDQKIDGTSENSGSFPSSRDDVKSGYSTTTMDKDISNEFEEAPDDDLPF